MNTQLFEMRWKEVKNIIQFLWGEISDAELEESMGDRDNITKLIEEKYGEDKSIIRTRLEPILLKLSDISEEMKAYFHEKKLFSTSYHVPPEEHQDRDISAI